LYPASFSSCEGMTLMSNPSIYIIIQNNWGRLKEKDFRPAQFHIRPFVFNFSASNEQSSNYVAQAGIAPE
jgi:hypothetical protein